ncbi:MAG: hypothetical protein DIKNOCCD_03137 [bacterium]|nr:hypothetical protein [bacterium]
MTQQGNGVFQNSYIFLVPTRWKMPQTDSPRAQTPIGAQASLAQCAIGTDQDDLSLAIEGSGRSHRLR